jgi:hypothetical protein
MPRTVEILVVLVLAAIAVAILAFGVWRSRATDREWAAAAAALGARFSGRGLFAHRRIQGRIRDLPFAFETYTRGSGKNSKTCTRLRVHYAEPLGLDLKITREGFWGAVTKFFGAQDIQVSDPAFDSLAIIKGRDPARVRGLLTPARRLRIARLFDSHPDAAICDAAVEWSRGGVIRRADRIVEHVKALGRLARHMGGDLEEDRGLDRVLDARARGRPDEALRILRGIPVEPAYEEKVLEGELLYLGGRSNEAKEAFAKAAQTEPGDPLTSGWMEVVSTAPPAPAPVDAGPVEDPASMLAALFPEGAMNFDVTRAFERDYRGRTVRWRGTLEAVESYTFDMVFGNEPGARAVVAVGELGTVRYGDRKVRAVVRLPVGADAGLKGAVGGAVAVEGNLERVDPLTRNLYLAEGRCEA